MYIPAADISSLTNINFYLQKKEKIAELLVGFYTFAEYLYAPAYVLYIKLFMRLQQWKNIVCVCVLKARITCIYRKRRQEIAVCLLCQDISSVKGIRMKRFKNHTLIRSCVILRTYIQNKYRSCLHKMPPT